MTRARSVFAFALLCAIAQNTLAQGAPPKANTAEADISKLSRAGEARGSGPDSAKVIILEFLDYACPVCAAFHNQRSDSLRKSLPADVRLVYVNFPLANHMRSFHGSEAAMCAGAVAGNKGFIAMVDRLYRGQATWSESVDPGPVFTRFAQEAAIDAVAFADCRARDAMAPLIITDLENASRFNVDATPTFVVIPRGAQSAEETFRASGNVPIARINELIGQARAKAK